MMSFESAQLTAMTEYRIENEKHTHAQRTYDTLKRKQRDDTLSMRDTNVKRNVAYEICVQRPQNMIQYSFPMQREKIISYATKQRN